MGKIKSAEGETIRDEKSVTVTIGRRKIGLSNLHKIYWPEEHITKGDMVRYYQRIAPYILPHLKDRPLSLKRNPNGIKDKGFFHKDAGEQAPDWMKVENIYADSAQKTIHYLVCNNVASLIYIANMGCIELNPWNSRVSRLDNPDYLVIDLDPADENSFEQVIEAAKIVKEILARATIEGYCKSSGSSGLHVYVPTGAKYGYEEIREFSKELALLVVKEIPEFTTTERPLGKRKGRMYVDFLQNSQGQTLACAYSLRPKPGASVSTPLEWKEVKKGLHPTDFNIKNIFKRLEKKGDLFAPVLKKGIDLKKCRKALGIG